MFEEKAHRNIPPVILLITHIIVFIIGLYISQDISYTHRAQSYYSNHLTSTETAKTNSVNVSHEISFYDIGMKYQTDKVSFHHYETMYEKYLRKYIGTNVSILEIGLGCGMSYGPGASAYLWRKYFGSEADIHFLEFDQNCGREWHKTHGKKLNVIMHYGSQEDVAFLNSINNTAYGYFDIIVDDGGHTMKQQITSFTYLLGKVRSGGLYIIEDLHTSYFNAPNSGYLVNSTTIELIKRLVDDIQVDSPRKSTSFSNYIFSFEISNKICFFNKK